MEHAQSKARVPRERSGHLSKWPGGFVRRHMVRSASREGSEHGRYRKFRLISYCSVRSRISPRRSPDKKPRPSAPRGSLDALSQTIGTRQSEGISGCPPRRFVRLHNRKGCASVRIRRAAAGTRPSSALYALSLAFTSSRLGPPHFVVVRLPGRRFVGWHHGA